jgi:hypothetical protein
MPKLLIIITSAGTPEIPDIWQAAGLQIVPNGIERTIVVIDGVALRDYDPAGEVYDWRAYVSQALNPHQQHYTNGISVGVVYHRVTVNHELEQAVRTYFNGRSIELRDFSGGGRGANANPMWNELYVPLAQAVQAVPQYATLITATFDKFWLDRFRDPILEDLILLLKTHALKKAEGPSIGTVDELQRALVREGSGEQQDRGMPVSEETISLVNTRLGDETGYDALRQALVGAIVARNDPNRR